MMKKVDLSLFNNDHYDTGRGLATMLLWFVVNVLFFRNPLVLFSGLKVQLLRSFGAKIGRGVVIKPAVNIKYPWRLNIGNHVWIGENVWIDNLDDVFIGNDVCLSQGALILSGNHNYKKPTFDLMIAPIHLEQGVWIGAKAVVTQGVICREGAVLATGSVASSTLESYTIYRGNPAKPVKKREISEG